MATKKASTTKSSSRAATTKKSPARAKTTTKVKASTTKSTKAKVAAVSTKKPAALESLPENLFGIVGAEVIGTFILTISTLLSISYQQVVPLFVGLTMVVLVLTIGMVSGAHVNPAVTFGLWASRKLKLVMVPFYWAAQLLGAVLAVLLLRVLSDGAYNISFGNFTEFNWSIASIELIGAAILVFGFVATVSRVKSNLTGKAVGIGLSLFVALVVTTSLFPFVQQGVDMTTFNPNDPSTLPRAYSVSGATVNPAIAIADTETSLAELQGGAASAEDAKVSRFGLETILGTLAGAAVGGNLWLLVSRGTKNLLD